jgi:murein DD-endopeptidase MepM/ murein hydrolase activator NlpD
MFADWKNLVFQKAEQVLKTTTSPLLLKEIAWRAVKFAVRCGHSNPISFALRPIASHKHFRSFIGVNIALLALGLAAISPLPSFAEAGNTGGVPGIVVATGGEVSLATKQAVKLPIQHFYVSQGFWFFHSGIDMASSIGEPIHPIMSGRVVQVERGWFGYGNMVVIAHTSEYESLYAHMSKIYVVQGQEVTTDTEIGEVGSTGHSTGPHLHLEIHEDGKAINPAPILGI